MVSGRLPAPPVRGVQGDGTAPRATAAGRDYGRGRPVPALGPAQPEDEYWAAKPADFSPEEWAALAHHVGAELKAKGGGTLELWTLAGLCSGGPRLYCPDATTYTALGNTTVNVPWESYAQPFPTFCLVIPEACSPVLEADIGRPVVIVGRWDRAERVVTFQCFGDSGVMVVLNWWATWTDTEIASGETVEYRIALRSNREEQMRTGRFPEAGPHDIPPTLDETTFLDHALRAWFNANLLLVNYGVRDFGRANPEYARRLESTLAKRQSPEGAKRHARSELHRMPQLVGFDQSVRLWHGGASDATTPAGYRVRPHWRRGHLAKQKFGPGRAQEKIILRPAVFVNRELHPTDAADFRTTHTG